MLAFLIFVVLLILCVTFVDFRKYYLAFKVPGQFPLPIFGNGLQFFNKTAPEMLHYIEKLMSDYGDTVGVWLGSDFNVFVGNPKSVEIILTSKEHIEKAGPYRYLKPWLNDGLILSKGSKYFQRRKMLTPLFHYNILEQFVEIFDRQSRVFIEILSQYSQQDKVEMSQLVTLVTLDVIYEAALGTQLNAQRSHNSQYVLAVKKLAHIVHFRMTKFMLRDDLMFRFSSLYSEQKNALRIVHGFTEKIVRDRKNDNDNKNGQKNKANLLDVLLKSTIDGHPLSDLDIQEELDTFMVGGHATAAAGLTFCLFNIAKHKNVQMKCFQEIRDVLGDDRTTSATINDLNNFKYLDLVIKETLRMFPSGPFIGRKLREETNIGKYTLPKGTEVVIPIYIMGRNPERFPNPEKFQPERFLEENNEESNRFAYIPFSAGVRSCVGQKFGVLEIKTVISKLLRHFEISLAEDSLQHPTLAAEVVLVSKSEMNFYVKPRVY